MPEKKQEISDRAPPWFGDKFGDGSIQSRSRFAGQPRNKAVVSLQARANHLRSQINGFYINNLERISSAATNSSSVFWEMQWHKTESTSRLIELMLALSQLSEIFYIFNTSRIYAPDKLLLNIILST
jgi:hypothetical protein